MKRTALQAKVEARNRVNLEHNRLLAYCATAFGPLVGKKILKVDGDLLEKFKHLSPVGNTRELMIYRLSSNYSLAFVVKACVSYGEFDSHCVYEEATVYVAELDGANLGKLIAPQPLPVNYTPEAILAAREEVKAAKEALRRAESKLAGFGEYDR